MMSKGEKLLEMHKLPQSLQELWESDPSLARKIESNYMMLLEEDNNTLTIKEVIDILESEETLDDAKQYFKSKL